MSYDIKNKRYCIYIDKVGVRMYFCGFVSGNPQWRDNSNHAKEYADKLEADTQASLFNAVVKEQP